MSIIAKIWSTLREQAIVHKHQKVASFWHNMIQVDARAGLHNYPMHPKMNLPVDKIIWQYWGQGTDEARLPEIVRYCFRSVDRYKGDFTVIRVDDSTISEYLDLPSFILEKRDKGLISRTFFSDILRLALLEVYGGVWLDATILMTKELPTQFYTLDYFVFQRDQREQLQEYWKNSYAYYWGWHEDFKVKMLNSIIFAKQRHPLIALMLHLLLNYWAVSNKAIDYFFYQILHEQLVPVGKQSFITEIESDVKPHLLQTKLSGGDYPMSYAEIFKSNGLHKLTYFDRNTTEQLITLLIENCGIYLQERSLNNLGI